MKINIILTILFFIFTLVHSDCITNFDDLALKLKKHTGVDIDLKEDVNWIKENVYFIEKVNVGIDIKKKKDVDPQWLSWIEFVAIEDSKNLTNLIVCHYNEENQ